MSKCPHCFKEIDPRATRCNHCGGEMETHMDELVKKRGAKGALKHMLMTMIMAIVICIALAYWWTNDIGSAILIGGIGGFLVGGTAFGEKQKKGARKKA